MIDNLIGSKYLYDKSAKHLTIYNSYNGECAARMIKRNELSNKSNAYSTANMKYDISNDTQNHLLWKQYFAWHCNGYTTAPIFDYINNPVFRKLLLESDYYGTRSDEKIYIDLWDSLGYTYGIEKLSRNDSKLNVTMELRNALAKEMRLRVWGYTNGEYLYMLTDGSLTFRCKTYTIKSLDDALEA